MKVSAIVPAAGASRRMGGTTLKQFIDLAGRPVVAHALAALEAAPVVQDVVLVVPPGMEAHCRAEYVDRFGLRKVRAVVAGGADRHGSVRAGLGHVAPDAELILVHDAARPLVTPDLIERVVEAAKRFGAAIAAIPMQDTPKIADSSRTIAGTLDRRRLWLAQTPQVFAADLLRRACDAPRPAGAAAPTDESTLVEALGREVRLVEGDWSNFKITTLEQLQLAERLLDRSDARPQAGTTPGAGR